MAVKNKDGRRYFRYEVLDYGIAFRLGDPLGVRCIIVDAGLGGLALRTKEELIPDEILDISVTGTSGQQLTLRVKVRHCVNHTDGDLFSVGVQFLPLSHEQRMAIAEYVNLAFQRQCDALIS